jgi:pimeloyl-ACP methyl ester carboxylesterase
MINLRRYGKTPFSVAVIHGGPGAAGEMAPVAKELSKTSSVLEPLQTANSIDGQIKELKNILNKHAKLPVTLIGHSWGAWLSFIFTARHPKLVKKLIMISSGPFEDKYVKGIYKTRMSRLNKKEQIEILSHLDTINNTDANNKKSALGKFGHLFSKADSFDSFSDKSCPVCIKTDIFQNVWKETESLRKNGKLLGLAKQIQCPVIAIHGDYDPHPAEGVKKPLSHTIKNFHFILLKNCGHTPWLEKYAREKYFDELQHELNK